MCNDLLRRLPSSALPVCALPTASPECCSVTYLCLGCVLVLYVTYLKLYTSPITLKFKLAIFVSNQFPGENIYPLIDPSHRL